MVSYMLMVKKIQEKIKISVPQEYWKLDYRIIIHQKIKITINYSCRFYKDSDSK